MIVERENKAVMEKEIISIFSDVKSKLGSCALFKERKGKVDYLLKMTYKIFGKYLNHINLDYNRLAFVFNRTYFWKNFLKCLLFFNEFDELLGKDILDVGCGAAPASIAMAGLALTKKENRISVSLIDKSRKQLDIAEDFLQRLGVELKSCSECTFVIRETYYDELVVFSYFFCEQQKGFINLLFDNRKKFSTGFLVIDYKENIELIEDFFNVNGDNHIETVYLCSNLSGTLLETVHEKEVRVYGCYYRP